MNKNENELELDKEQNLAVNASSNQATKNKKSKVLTIMIIVISVILVSSIAYNVATYAKIQTQLNYSNYIKELENLKNEKGLQELTKINDDFVAWITIEEQNISVPIVKTENENEENFYLDHDFKKNNNVVGSPYQKHDTNIFSTDNTTFVGHSCFSTTFFGKTYYQAFFAPLNNYIYEQKSYNYKIKVETLSETFNYKICAIIHFDIRQDYSKQNAIYQTTNFSNESDFNNYYKNVKDLACTKTSETINYGDKLLTLFTCSMDLNFRTMVIAKRV